MMWLDFGNLPTCTQKTVGHSGTGGTPSIHAGLGCPTIGKRTWDTVGQPTAPSASTPADNPNLSHLSHRQQNEVGHDKPSVYAVVPLVPPVPPKKTPNEIDREAFEERAAIMEFIGETDKAVRAEVIVQCQQDANARGYFLGRSSELKKYIDA